MNEEEKIPEAPFGLNDIFEAGAAAPEWAAEHTPKESLTYGREQAYQIEDIKCASHLLGIPARIVGKHRSKSVELPVTMFQAHACMEEIVYFFVRNNFHDIKLSVISSCPIHLDYARIHEHVTREQYFEERAKSFNYCKSHKGFDPKTYDGHDWVEDWSRWSILVDEQNEYYRCSTASACYYEGMADAGVPPEAFHRYEHGRSAFSTEVSGSMIDVISMMQYIRTDAQRFVLNRREEEYAAKTTENDRSKAS